MKAILLPGQGSQFVGMAKDLAAEFREVRDLFAEADDALGFALSKICWEGPEDELRLTSNAQPALLVHSVAVWNLIRPSLGPDVSLAAGHSLGEFSAYTVGGALEFRDAVKLVRTRGELMARAGEERQGAMAAILGLADEAVEDVCRRATETGVGSVVPANYNSPGQVVISGDAEAVALAGELARQAGARRPIPLNVSGAFHSPLMASAEAGLREALGSVRMVSPRYPVISNVTAQPVTDAAAARDLMVRQLTAPVRWAQSIQIMVNLGVTEFVEVGAGHVLGGLVRRINKDVPTRSLGTLADVQALIVEA